MQQVDSSDDEEHFRKKELKRTERDTAKLRPLILGMHLPASIPAQLQPFSAHVYERSVRLAPQAYRTGEASGPASMHSQS